MIVFFFYQDRTSQKDWLIDSCSYYMSFLFVNSSIAKDICRETLPMI